MNYYSEWDKKTAAWLRELIKAGLIPAGDVDDRSIAEVKGHELGKYTQCHFFAGVAGWSEALRLAGWRADEPVWTGSCPCQSFSSAGKGKGHGDARNLWPEMFRLIRECRPPVVIGEQVDAAIGYGWLDGVFVDLEAENYACGAAVLPASCVGAPHIRQRLFWLADSKDSERRTEFKEHRETSRRDGFGRRGETGGLADAKHDGRRTDEQGRKAQGRIIDGRTCGLGDVFQSRLEGHVGNGGDGNEPGRQHTAETGPTAEASATDNAWSDFAVIPCRDGKARRIKSNFQFISDGISDIMGPGWDSFLAQLKEEVIGRAKKTSTGPGEVLRAMWKTIASPPLWNHIGGHDSFYEPEILLIALCQLARHSQREFDIAASDICEIEKTVVRILWPHSAINETTPCPSCEPQLARSSTGKSENTLHCVPFSAPSQISDVVQGLRRKISTRKNVSETLSEMEEIWRSVSDKDYNIERFRTGARIVKSLAGFPLSETIPGRTTLLRGAGNSIVPQVAAEFIMAFMETKSPSL